MNDHRKDSRIEVYTGRNGDAGTHNPYWNAAQEEMIVRWKI